jgi:aminoglycoside 6'-N-acetyltransferase I
VSTSIHLATLGNLHDVVPMVLELWPHHSYEELEEEFTEILSSEKYGILLYKADDIFVGFNYVAIRQDYVEGSSSSPTGFIEGIFVKEAYRNKGIAKALARSGEQWAKTKGCTQMGSDVEFHNNSSYEFHKKIGYTEVNRIICFLRGID